MASQFTNYLEAALLNHVFGKGTYTVPTIYVALGTNSSDPSATGSGFTEVSGTGYTRKSTAAADWNSAALSGSVEEITNANAVIFAQAGGSWGTVRYFALFDAGGVSGGNMLGWGVLSSPQAVGTGDTVQFAATYLVITLV